MMILHSEAFKDAKKNKEESDADKAITDEVGFSS
jgi:hypothetical protein